MPRFDRTRVLPRECGMIMNENLNGLLGLLRQPPVYCAVLNRFACPEADSRLCNLGCSKLEGLPFVCYTSLPTAGSPQVSIPPSPQSRGKLLDYYAMDIASLYPVLALSLSPSDTVLDLCAAPGGKAFAILQVLRWEEGGALALNDTSPSRVKRLKQVVHQCVGSGLKHPIRITRQRGEDLGQMEPSEYNKVLVDAPCSSDRHNAAKWSAKDTFWPNTTSFNKLQEELVLSALCATKAGGDVVYSTCTLSSHENDDTIERVLNSALKLGYEANSVVPLDPELESSVFGEVEKTSHGRMIIPRQNLNCGPMYISKLLLTKKKKYYSYCVAT